jgi:hypothetical protein
MVCKRLHGQLKIEHYEWFLIPGDQLRIHAFLNKGNNTITELRTI